MSIAARVARVSSNIETATRSGEFITIARALCASGGWGAAAKNAQAYNLGPRQVELMQRSAVAPLSSTSVLGEAGLVSAFVESLRSVGTFDRMLSSMVRVPLKTKIVLTTVGATGYIAGEGQVKAISKLTLAGSELDPLTAVSIVILSEELARSVSREAVTLFGNELKRAVTAATDEQFISIATAGIVPLASTGPTATAARADIRALLQNISTDARSSLFLLMSSATAKALSIISDPNGSTAFPTMAWNGGTIAGVEAVVTDSVTDSELVLVDASGFAASSLDIRLDSAKHADLDLSTSPDSPASANTAITTLWQRNLAALRAERIFGCERLRADATAIISNINYTGNSPA